MRRLARARAGDWEIIYTYLLRYYAEKKHAANSRFANPIADMLDKVHRLYLSSFSWMSAFVVESIFLTANRKPQFLIRGVVPPAAENRPRVTGVLR